MDRQRLHGLLVGAVLIAGCRKAPTAPPSGPAEVGEGVCGRALFNSAGR